MLTQESIETLQGTIKGTIILPGDATYDETRAIWNAMIDKRPVAIIQCHTSNDVVHTLAYARENSLEFSVRGAGHNIAGNSIVDDGLMIDLSTMTQVKVDTDSNRVFVEPGATLGDLDAATQAHGLAVPVGINSTTGIAGLTLGGGFGWLTRKYGMTVDCLVSAQVITVNGKMLRVSESENEDLFWAIRGGGGNYGIVTEFEFQAFEVGPDILAGLLVFPIEQAKLVLQQYRDYVAGKPEEFNAWVVMRKAPPLPFLPEEVHGREVVVLAMFYVGDIEEGQKLIAPIREFGNPYGEHVGTQPFTDWQQAFDPLLTPGARNYWKSHNFTDLNDDLFDIMIEFSTKLPTPQCEIFIALIEGAPNLVAPDAMAWGHRDARFVLNVHGRWDDAGDDDRCIAWAREFFTATKPFASSGAYVNFMTEDEGDRVESAYGANYTRLVEAKRKYDPENVLHLNQNIKP